MSLKTIPRSGSPGYPGSSLRSIALLGEQRPDGAPEEQLSSCEAEASVGKVLEAGVPAFRFLERSAGATTCSSRPASRSAPVRKLRRWRGDTP